MAKVVDEIRAAKDREAASKMRGAAGAMQAVLDRNAQLLHALQTVNQLHKEAVSGLSDDAIVETRYGGQNCHWTRDKASVKVARISLAISDTVEALQ